MHMGGCSQHSLQPTHTQLTYLSWHPKCPVDFQSIGEILLELWHNVLRLALRVAKTRTTDKETNRSGRLRVA